LIYICCTARLEAGLGYPPLIRPEPTPSRLGIWYANDLDDRNAILLNVHSRLVVILPMAPHAVFADQALVAVRARVAQIPGPRAAVDLELDSMTTVAYTNTPHRSLRSYLEAIRGTATLILSDHPRRPLDEVARQLCDMPVRAKGFHTPWELAVLHLGGSIDRPGDPSHAT
jgi:hypothetical protein